MKIDHIGIACKNISQAQKQYEQLGFVIIKDLITDFERNLDYIFMENEGYVIELVAVNDSQRKSDIDTILAQVKLIGYKMYHVCFLTNDMDTSIKKYLTLGYKLIKLPAPAIACDNKCVAFLIHIELGMIELLEE